MKDFQYKTIDPEGHLTLDAVANAPQFNQWIYQTILPFCSGNILETGSGIGNISSFFLEDGHLISLSDIRPHYRSIVEKRFGHFENLAGIFLIDLTDPDFDDKHKALFHTFDTVFSLNVIEHIKDDQLAIRNCNKLLKTGGNLIILVPAFQWLYNRFDHELAHYRRYNQTQLDRLLKDNGFAVIHRQYFNFPGIFGWIFSGNILGMKTIPSGQMKVYDKLVPLFKIADKVIFNKLGLSVISVGKKT